LILCKHSCIQNLKSEAGSSSTLILSAFNLHVCVYWGVDPVQCIQYRLDRMCFWLEGTRLPLHYAVLTIWGNKLSDTTVKVVLGALGVD